MFGKKTSERMLMRKVWNHVIEIKEGFVLRKGRYICCREKRDKRCVSL